MTAKSVAAIALLLLVVTCGIDMVLKGPTEVRSTTQRQNGCGCITVPKPGPELVVPFAAKPTLFKGGVAAFYFHGDYVEDGINSYLAEGSQE
jgi:hypothetical protein